MATQNTDTKFAGSIPEIYDRYLVPLIFDGYAQDLAGRLAAGKPRRVLEVAAGTGVVTRRLATALPATTSILATDLNQAMIDHGRKSGTSRPVEWKQADAMQLPFADEAFDAVVCQFGVMFFPDKAKAFSEARRVLKPGGAFVFNVWDRIEENEFADVATNALATIFPHDAPRFMARTPHGYHDRGQIERDLRAGGLGKSASFTTLPMRSRAPSAESVAIAYCQGTPLRNEIESRGSVSLADATKAVTEAIAGRFGRGPVDGKIQAIVVAVET